MVVCYKRIQKKKQIDKEKEEYLQSLREIRDNHLKETNNKLREKLYLLSRRLYTLEVINIFIYIYLFINYRWNIVML